MHQRLCSVCGPIALYAEQWVRLGTGDRRLSLPCVNQERPWLTHRFWIHIHPAHFFWLFNNPSNERSCVLCCSESRFSGAKAQSCLCGVLYSDQQWSLLSVSQRSLDKKKVHKPWTQPVITIRIQQPLIQIWINEGFRDAPYFCWKTSPHKVLAPVIPTRNISQVLSSACCFFIFSMCQVWPDWMTLDQDQYHAFGHKWVTWTRALKGPLMTDRPLTRKVP